MTANVVILGTGFGGITVAMDLSKKLEGRIKVIIIDINNYHL